MSAHSQLRRVFHNGDIRRAVLAASAGVVLGALLLLTTGHRLIVVNDEGIYLEGAVRVLQGEVPYRDFFAICGPGSFWLLAAIFRVMGVSLFSAHILLAFDVAVISALIWWVTSSLASNTTALCATLLFGMLSLSAPNNIVVNHRWDSSALALVAIAAIVSAIQMPRRSLVVAAGVFSILAAWVTPPAGLLAIAIGGWIYSDSRLRWTAPSYVGGILAGISMPAAVLMWQGAMVPMAHNLIWTGAQYSAANRSAYGAVFDSPLKILTAATGVSRIRTTLLLLAMFLPAILPPVVAMVWAPSLRRPHRPEPLLLICGVVLVATAYPRWDLLHLLFISPVFLILAAVWMERVPPRAVAFGALAVFSMPALAMCAYNLLGGEEVTMDSPVGRIKVSPGDVASVAMGLERIQPKSTLFVFPYEPIFYFLTGARNPTRFDFLQPGMMSVEDENTAVAELMNRPPERVLYRDVPAEAYLRIWPSSNLARLRMNAMEDFLRTHYQVVTSVTDSGGEHRLLARR